MGVREPLSWRAHFFFSSSADAFMLENFAYYILHKYLGSDPQYLRLVKEMQRTGLRTIFGQSLDSRFSLKRDMNE